MFKLESYITPIILSQVERYVKNIRAEDSQVSLWGGDAVFNNLDLRLDVLEEELRLPFSLVSGHIHELQIHVPWTRLHTEPIVLTINTIECVLKLPSDRATSVVSSASSQDGNKAEERKRSKRTKEEQSAPPGYIQGLINKIISNIQIVCNNLILKYVEDDLVLSLNVRTASFASCNEAWVPAFTELTLPDLILRKLVSVSDLTICLDRRSATGKIEVYQDPLLYRCSLSVRVGWCYQSLTAKVPFRTVINVLADRMDFSMTGVQVPMVVRLSRLFLAFYYGELGTKDVQERRKSKNPEDKSTEVNDSLLDEEEGSLGGLLWDVGTSLGTALLPVYWEDEDNPPPQNLPPIKISSQLGCYIRESSLTLKLAANVKPKGFYRGGKQSFNSYLICKVQGIYAEVSTKGSNWIAVQAGVSQVVVSPVGQPSETLPNYILSGCESNKFLERSLFAPEYGEEESTKPKELRHIEEEHWDVHIETVTETSLLEKTPALAMDYVYNLDIPSDIGSEDLSELGHDLENSNLPERALCRFVIGPAQVHLSESAISRANTVLDLVNDYDYLPYIQEKPEPGPEGLTLPTKEEIDNLENNNPVRVYRLTLLHPSLTLHSKGGRIEAGLRCADIVQQVPMYPLRNVRAGSVMHPPSKTILNNCHSNITVTLMDTWVKLNIEKFSYRLVSLDKATFSYRCLLFKQFWKNLYQKHGDMSLKFDSIQLSSSMPQLTMAMSIVENVLRCKKVDGSDLTSDCNGKEHPIVSSLFTGTNFAWTWTSEIYTLALGIDGASVSLKGHGRVKPVPIFTGISQISSKNSKLANVGHSPGKALPETVKPGWLKFTVQWPSGTLTHNVPTLLYAALGETFILADPKLGDVLKYAASTVSFTENEKYTESSVCNSALKSGKHIKLNTSETASEVTLLQCLSGTIIDVKCGGVSLYLSDKTLSNVSGQTVLDVVNKAGKTKNGSNLVNLSLLSADIHNANGKVDLSQYSQHPVLFAPAVWTSGKENFPWSISLKGFSVGRRMDSQFSQFLQPVTTNCTFGTSSKGKARNLAICIHADMTALEFFVDTPTLTSLVMVSQCLVSTVMDSLPPSEESTDSQIKVEPVASTSGPAIIQRSLGSVSESATPVTSGIHSESLISEDLANKECSLWLQWTIPQWTWTMVGGHQGSQTKLTFLFEDSSASIDKQATYTKLKFRIRSVTGNHFVEKDVGEFVPGNFPGRTISCQPDLLKTIYAYSPESAAVETLSDDDDVPVNCLSKGVFNLTITKAECQNVIRKLKSSSKDNNLQIDQINQPKRFLTEFDFEMNPIDVFLPTNLLPPILKIFYPLTQFTIPTKPGTNKSMSDMLLQFNNNNLPMVYLKSERLRMFLQIPREKMTKQFGKTTSDDLVPDFLLLQMKKATITSQVENPLTRILVDVPLYHQAANSHLLGVPGSQIEDRQYQVDLRGITLATGHWQDIVEKNKKADKTLLRTMSENPALEWNTNRQAMEEANEVVMVPIIYDFCIKLMIAPAIVHKKFVNEIPSEILVAGISAEVNAVTDVNLCTSLQQILFLYSLKDEIESFTHIDSKIVGENKEIGPVTDSGVDCNKPDDSIMKNEERTEMAKIPIELLLTCNNVRLAFHKFERSNASVTSDDVRMWRRYHHANRKAVAERRISMDSDVTEVEEREKEERNVLTDPIPLPEDISTEVGYEGSEDESCVDLKTEVNIRLIPLFSIKITHPHIFFSLSSTEQKMDLSIYNLLLACSPEGFHLPANSGKKIPWQRDFPTVLLETRPGKPDSKSGIPPALLTLTVNNILSESLSLNCKLERPVLLSASQERYKQVCKIVEQFGGNNTDRELEENEPDTITTKPFVVKDIRVKTSQIMCSYDCKEKDVSCTLTATFGGSAATIEIANNKENVEVYLGVDLERLAISLAMNDTKHSLLDPANFGLTVKKSLGGGQMLSNCFVKIQVDQCYVHVGPNHVFVLETIMNNLKEHIGEMNPTQHDTEMSLNQLETASESEVEKQDNSDQHYQDDLRAGAFQFLDSVIDGKDTDPAPYQVVFNKTTLTWRYPQSRTLSKVVIFPLPFMEASEFSLDNNETVDCELLFWSETLQSFVVYQTFQLSESSIIHLDLPIIRDRKACSSSTTWQVRLNRLADQAYITPQALISVLKVDSFSSPKLLPDSQISASISSLKFILHNHLHYAGKKLTNEFEDLALDSHFPLDQTVFKVCLSPLSLGVSIWPDERLSQLIQCSMKTKLNLEFVDYAFLGVHKLLKPTDVDVWVQHSREQYDTTAKVGYLDVAVGPFFMHSLRQSSKIWKQVLERLKSGRIAEPDTFIPLCQTLVVNETGQMIRFGQADTDENILLQPKYCSMYAWRSNKASQKLNVSIESKDWAWSKPFTLTEEGVQMVQMSSEGLDKNLQLVVHIEKKSSTLCIVKFCGMLNILNLLKEHIELRILPKSSKEVRCLIGSYCRPTSVVTKCDGCVVKIRFFGLGTPWSGDIPLEAVVGKRKSFMIKLPLKDKGTSTTVWCTILTEVLNGEMRKMLIFSPMYVISSQLPGVISTSINCSTSDAQSELTVQGFGHTEQLDVMGAPENKFNMSFKLSPELPASSPPLNVSWGIIDQVREKNGKIISINEVINSSHKYNLRTNTPDGIMKEILGLKITEQPKTDCKVTFSQFHPVTNTLCVKVQPNFLIINKSDLPILTKQKDGSSWMLEPYSVFHPPPMTDNKFYFGLQDVGGKETWGPPLELSDHEWTYLSIRPSIQGVIHLHGSMMYNLSPDENNIGFVTLTSDVSDGIRMLIIKPSFVVSNQTTNVINFKAEVRYERPNDNLIDNQDFHGTVQAANNDIKPLSFWSLACKGEGSLVHSLHLSCDDHHWSSVMNIPLDDDSRVCTTIPTPEAPDVNTPVILLTHRSEGQVFIIVKEDKRPQVKLHNGLLIDVVFKEEGSANFEVIKETQSLYLTMPWLNQGFPFTEQNKQSRKLQFSLENNGWSTGIDITSTQETFINLPGHGDVRITVECLQPTIYVYIEPVSNLEVAARDIRARFAEPSSPETVFLSPNSSFVTVGSPECESFSDCLTEDRVTEKTVASPVPSSRRPSTASTFSVITKPLDRNAGHFLSFKLKEFSMAFTDDLWFDDDFQEIMRMTMSNVELDCRPKMDYSTLYKTLGGQHSQELEIDFKIGDFQVDNQMFKRGLYHFPVLISSQEVQKESKHTSSKLIEAKITLIEAANTHYSNKFLLKMKPLAINLEDTFFYKIQEYMKIGFQSNDDIGTFETSTDCNELVLPPNVIFAAESASQMVYLDKILIEEIDLQVSAHASVKVFVGLEDSKINLSKFENCAVWLTWYSLGHRLSMHYLSGALFKAGWVVGSLDMIGSPAAFTRTVSDGVKDFVSLPYNGIWHGPWGLLVGLSQGSSSLVKHVSAGTLTSITNFASSMSRNLDRLSFDSEHLIRNEEVRRLKPQGIGEGLINGLSGVGISLLGAIGGLAHHPIQVLLEDGVSPVKLMGGVGRGMVGVVTKPLGSAAELIAQTGHGMLTGSGWARTRRPRLSSVPSLVFDLASSQLKYQWKVLHGDAACVVDASLFEENQYIAVSVVLSKNAVHIISEDEDATKNVYNIDEVNLVETIADPTLLVLELKSSDIHEKYQHINDRVARFVLESISFAEHGLDPEFQPSSFSDSTMSKVLLYMSPHTRVEFCTIFYQLKEEQQKIGFPVLF